MLIHWYLLSPKNIGRSSSFHFYGEKKQCSESEMQKQAPVKVRGIWVVTPASVSLGLLVWLA